MKLVLHDVEPIRPGYEASIRLQFPADFYAAWFAAGRLVAQFRSALPSPVMLFEADSDDGTIVRDTGARSIRIVLPADATAPMDGSSQVVFDFVRVAGAARTPIPGRVLWPVLRTVTRDVE